MKALIESLGKPLYQQHDHYGYLIDWRLIAPICVKWSRNRDPDQTRIEEMYQFYLKGGYIPAVIHLAELNTEGLVCYDGNHRRELYNRLINQDEALRLAVMIDVVYQSNQNTIYDAFNALNRSIQVPAIYLEEQDSKKINDELLKIVKSYETKYKKFLSTSSRCHPPHFNRDSLLDNLYEIYKAFNGKIDVGELMGLLEELNKAYASGDICRPHENYRENVINKCKEHGLWLFLERRIPFEHVYLLHQRKQK